MGTFQKLALLTGLILLAVGFFGYLATTHTQTPQTPTRIQAIVVNGQEAKYDKNEHYIGFTGLVRLLSNDTVNGLNQGDIVGYMIKTSDSNTNYGYLIEGTTSNENGQRVFTVSSGRPFFTQFVNSGNLTMIDALNLNGNDDFSFEVENFGEYDVTYARASINGITLPFAYGVSTDTPVKPSTYYTGQSSTTWHDPAASEIQGIHLEVNHTYSVHIVLGLSDGSKKVVDRNVTYRPFFGIASLGPVYPIEGSSPDLIEVNPMSGSSLVSVTFRNTWWSSDGFGRNITKVELFVDDVPVGPVGCNLRMGGYWTESTRTPVTAYIGQTHKVSIRVTSSDGLIYVASEDVVCQPV